ncbi:MAG: iron-containing alcohol dehydrogenase [Acidobacteria bacterium]|nr:iron-containing alcohol dehydrogenase [Acidobacteriota bacterium]MBI3655805.1 iron-containing alcohol dehydrogenase [Acidobacteriota bacterium]
MSLFNYNPSLEFIFRHSTKLIFGIGAIRELTTELNTLGARRALLITDTGIVRSGLAATVRAALKDHCVGVFSEVPANSSLTAVQQGVTAARGMGADSVVLLGGGSVMDTGKCIATLLRTGGLDIRDHLSLNQLEGPVAPMIAVPTTAGTGSEVSYGAVVRDPERNTKMVFADHFIAPNTAILDPHMTEGMPPWLTAATGMDAMTHDIEAYASLQGEPISDALALHSLQIIAQYLPACVDNGHDLTARGQMQLAACMAAIAFNNAILGLTHAMAHALGGRYGIHHGTANALFLPHVMRFNLETVPERYAILAEALGVDTRGMSTLDAGRTAADAVAALTRRLALPERLRDISGVDIATLPSLAEAAMIDACLITNPRLVTDPGEILSVYQQAW